LWIICLLLHLSENNVKITQFSLYLGVLFTWQDSHYQYQYGCSTNKSQMGLKSFVFNLSCSKCVRVHFIYVRSRILKRGTYEALRQSSLFVKTFVNIFLGGNAHLLSAEGFYPQNRPCTPKLYMQGYKVKEKTAIVPHCTPIFKTQWAP
jgi:hypothetical protein